MPDYLFASEAFSKVLGIFLAGHLIGVFICGPAVLSIYNILYLFIPHCSQIMSKRSRWMELLTILFGGLCFWMVSGIHDARWDANWWEQLYNAQLHAPLATWTYPTLITIGSIGILGYFVLFIARERPLPPLVSVFGLGCLYLGTGFCLVFLIQLAKHNWVACLYLGNLLLISLKVVKELVLQYKNIEPGDNTTLRFLHRFLNRGRNLPWLGLVSAIPLLGIILAILTLFGQAPDSIIQAWTQTSDWTLSQQTAPPNLVVDQHYLCTVAARGHRQLVKPIRMGKRHGGHWVLVNRQLAVANAFEELLQERTPRFQKALRSAYDRYGYPIAMHIHSPWSADVVWLLMKPAEWFFLVVLYLFDLKPENRIAVQYPHAPLPGKDEKTV